jgi:Nif-specific regulatory protein
MTGPPPPPVALDAGAELALAVAPRCNLACAACERRSGCRSCGAAAEPLAVDAAVAAVAARCAAGDPPTVVVVRGPGDALANPDELFALLAALTGRWPDLPRRVATNGLALPELAERLVDAGVDGIDLTIHAADPDDLTTRVAWVRTAEGIREGRAGAERLLACQAAGVRALRAAGVDVRAVHPVAAGDPAAVAARAGRAAALVRRWGLPGLALADAGGGPAAVAAAAAACRPGAEPPPPPAPLPAEDAGHVPHRHLALVARIAHHLADADRTDADLARVIAWLERDLGLQRGVIALADDAGDEVQAAITAQGIAPGIAGLMRYRSGEGLTGQVFATGTPVFVASLAHAPAYLDRSGLRRGLDLAGLAFFCVPIVLRGLPIGTLSADKDHRDLKDADGDLAVLGEVAHLLAPFLRRRRLESRLETFTRLSAQAGEGARLVGRCPAVDEVRKLIAKVAPAPTTVLITGETGTGKGVVARLIHACSPRAAEPCIEVNCGAIPEHLIESELFGHEKGAFTGALARRQGVFERARGGTVFLDEVGELPGPAQTRLLQVLQTKRFTRVGGSEVLASQARIIAATNRDFAAAIAEGAFRSDLFYRVSVFPILLPPLRDRGKADIMLLADRFVERFAAAQGKRIFRLDTPAIDMLTAYHWPGNVRELENVIERAVVLADGEVIHGHHLPPSLQMRRYAAAGIDGDAGDFPTQVANFEIGLITDALKDCAGNQTQAAVRLGITKRIVQYKIKQYGIDRHRFH